MKNSLIYKLAITASLSVVAVSCAPSTPTASTTPSAMATTSAATPKPSASPTSSATPSASAKPSESPTDKAPDTVRVAVVNNSGKELTAVYMSAPSKQDWGKNELNAPVPDREKADFEWNRSDYKGAEAGCLFEVRAEYADSTNSELDAIDLCKTPAINLK